MFLFNKYILSRERERKKNKKVFPEFTVNNIFDKLKYFIKYFIVQSITNKLCTLCCCRCFISIFVLMSYKASI